MLYHPGRQYAYTVGSTSDLVEGSVDFMGVRCYANAPTGARLSPQSAFGLTKELGRGVPGHPGGAWKTLSTGGLTDEELVYLAESAHWRAGVEEYPFRPFIPEGDDPCYYIW